VKEKVHTVGEARLWISIWVS